MKDENIQNIADAIKNQKNIVFFTGAGISIFSGISPYRGKNGIWNKDLAKLNNLPRKEIFEYLKEKIKEMEKYSPNSTHYIISQLQEINPNITIITQNIDRLHSKALNKNIIELHGSAETSRCDACNTPLNGDIETCPECGGFVRPDVVWFGESLNQETVMKAVESVKNADMFISMGTSAQVYPAANLIGYAIDRNIPVYEVNPEKTDFTEYVTYHFKGESSYVMNDILKNLKNVNNFSE